MKRTYVVMAFGMALSVSSFLQAQTSYPMLMGLDPVAAQVGKTSEHTVSSRYSMFGAYRILVSGDGVTGDVVTEMKVEKGKQPPNLTSLKVKFSIAPDAQPGVRDFRIATPQGVSTLGQLVIVRDSVVTEKGNNNTSEQAQLVALPAAFCGRIEKREDVDFIKFKVDAGRSLSFHVRSMRLQDRIHDLQTHSDPIIFLRNSSGTTIAQSDNHYAGDPLLSHRFERAGDYLLEVRDVRYEGNGYWGYSIEINERPFVANLFPLGLSRGKESKVELIGFQLPDDPMTMLKVPMDVGPGSQQIRVPLENGLSDPVPVVVNDLPNIVEAAGPNNAPEQGQPFSVPAGISGRIESEADIDCYTFEAKKGEKFSFEVIARRRQSSLDSIIRILNEQGKQLSLNDDLRIHKHTHKDSWIENWSAPADGKYTVEIRDLHLRGGDSFVYFLKVTRSGPYFELYLDTDKTQLTPGTSGVIFARVVRKNGFDGEVQLNIDGLPKGITAECGRILAGSKNQDGCIILTAKADAPMAVSNVTVTGTAKHKLGDDKSIDLQATAVPQQETYMPGGGRNHWQVGMHTVSVGAPGDIRSIKLSTNDLTLKPGESKRIDVTIERSSAYQKNITLDLLYRHLGSVYGNTLPPGVTIDSVHSKTLLTGKETKGHITLKADPKAGPIEKQQVSVMANISLNFVMKATYCSERLLVTVAKPAEDAAAKK